MLAPSVEQVQRAGQVHVVVEPRIVDRDAHAGHRRQVGDGGEAVLGEQLLQQGAITNVALDEGERLVGAGQSGQLLQVGTLARRIVIIVEVVDADDLVAALDERRRSVAANETGGAGDQNRFSRHAAEPTPSPRG